MHVQTMAKPPPALLLTEPEFHQLPTSIQRKYFSTLERLQIAQNSLYHCDAPHTSQPRSTSNSLPKSKPGASLHLRRPHANLDCLGPGLVSNADARWFLSLPDKVRRQHFSREEQHRLEGQIAASDSLRSRSTSRNTGKYSATSTNSLIPPQSLTDSTPTATRASHDLLWPSTEAMNCFDGRPSVARRNSRKSSMRRTLSKSKSRPCSVATHVRTPSATAPQSPATPSFPQYRPGHSRSATLTLRPSIDSVSRSFDPTATYYQDPEARQKLRQYLASPQKFDEAVEFGFPSHATAPDADVLFRNHRSTSSNDAQAFLKDEVISFIDRYDDDDASENSSDACPDSPATPADSDELFRRKPYGSSIFAGLDSTDIPSLNFKMEPDMFAYRFSHDPLANREMTLRMTLTRPDLRANAEDLYGWSRKEDDPLALEQLPMSDDTTGENGAFAVKPNNRRSGMFKRIFGIVKNER